MMASNVYKFTDANGNILFTNVVNGRKKPSGEDFKQYTRLEKVTWFKDTNVHSYGNWGNTEFAVRPSFSKNRNAFLPEFFPQVTLKGRRGMPRKGHTNPFFSQYPEKIFIIVDKSRQRTEGCRTFIRRHFR